MARRVGGEEQTRNWLFANQQSMSADEIRYELRSSFGLSFDEALRAALAAVQLDVQFADSLGADATPSVWINGVRVDAQPPENVKWALKHELSHPPRTGTGG